MNNNEIIGGIKKGIYCHIKSGNFYEVFGRPQMKVNEEWVDGVIYASLSDRKAYVRTQVDFSTRFQRIQFGQYVNAMNQIDKSEMVNKFTTGDSQPSDNFQVEKITMHSGITQHKGFIASEVVIKYNRVLVNSLDVKALKWWVKAALYWMRLRPSVKHDNPEIRVIIKNNEDVEVHNFTIR